MAGGRERQGRAGPAAVYLPAAAALVCILVAGLFAERQSVVAAPSAAPARRCAAKPSGRRRGSARRLRRSSGWRGPLAVRPAAGPGRPGRVARGLRRGTARCAAAGGRARSSTRRPGRARAGSSPRRTAPRAPAAARRYRRRWLVLWTEVRRTAGGERQRRAVARGAGAARPGVVLAGPGRGRERRPRAPRTPGRAHRRARWRCRWRCRAAAGRCRRRRSAAGIARGARWPIRLLTLLAAGLIVGPMIRNRHLVEDRQRTSRRSGDARPSSRSCRAAWGSRSTPPGWGSGTSTSPPTAGLGRPDGRALRLCSRRPPAQLSRLARPAASRTISPAPRPSSARRSRSPAATPPTTA